MDVILQPSVLERLKQTKIHSIRFHRSMGEPGRSLRVDITKLAPAQLAEVEAALTADAGDKQNASGLRAIQTWRSAKTHPGDHKPKSVKAMRAFLVRYLAEQPEGRFYAQTDQDAATWLPYVTTKIEYKPPREYEPAHVVLEGNYLFGGKVKNESWSFYHGDLTGRTVIEAFTAKGLMRETAELRAAHQIEVACFRDLVPRIGHQFRATGYGKLVQEYGSDEVVPLQVEGDAARVVIDDPQAEDEDRRVRGRNDGRWHMEATTDIGWLRRAVKTTDEDMGEEERENAWDGPIDHAKPTTVEIPVHPYVYCFDLRRHRHVYVHATDLTEYAYDPSLGASLVLPAEHRELVDILIAQGKLAFRDIIHGKAVGNIILAVGPPGTGKTLTAEVYAEVMQRALYAVQCSQLGTNAEAVEKALQLALRRTKRWGAILLIDEADVYVRDRGDDVEQNAIVGVFLRLLEYFSGVLFLATNRGTIIDDAIASRATTRLDYGIPSVADQARIWRILADRAGIPVTEATIGAIAEAHPALSGRDVRNTLKLASLIAERRTTTMTVDVIEAALKYRPLTTKEPNP